MYWFYLIFFKLKKYIYFQIFFHQVYASITDQVTAFFVEMGITQVTIQPEFHKVR